MSLPLPWVERIFTKLVLVYGQAFLVRWRDIDIAMVKTDWTHELSGFDRTPHRIAFALANLPEKPPSVIEFKALCRSAPALPAPALEAPPANPERMAQELAKLAPMLAETPGPVDDKAWARKILARVQAGERVTPTVLQMALRGLGMPDGT
jgi:hypothetical protein